MNDYLKAVELAEKELKESNILKIKEVVKQTLEKIEDLLNQKKTIEEQIKILKMDIDDLKAGKLDKIEERQKVNPEAREISIIVIRSRKIVPRDPWRTEWTVTWGGTHWTTTGHDWTVNTAGTYKLGSGIIKYI